MARTVASALVSVTGSPLDAEAVAMACDLVRPAKGVVWLLYVVEIGRSLPLDAEVPWESTRGEQVLQAMEALARSRKCRAEGEILQARDRGSAVVDEAAQRECDIVIAAVPYEEHYGSPTLGGFSPYLLKHSPCRVLIYREEQPAYILSG